MAIEEMPWASGALRGSGPLAAEDEKEVSEIASADARQRRVFFIARCLAVPEKAVKWEHYQSNNPNGAIDRVGPVYRSAGFQPAVSPIFNRQIVAMTTCVGFVGAPAGWKHYDAAGFRNLRCDFVHAPNNPNGIASFQPRVETRVCFGRVSTLG